MKRFLRLPNALVATNVSRVPDALSAAAEPTRRRILQLLASGPRTVNDLAANFSVTRSAISQHLGVLAEVGLVSNRKEGRQRIYSVEPTGIATLRAEIERFWTDELDLLVADANRLAHGRDRHRREDHRPAPTDPPHTDSSQASQADSS